MWSVWWGLLVGCSKPAPPPANTGAPVYPTLPDARCVGPVLEGTTAGVDVVVGEHRYTFVATEELGEAGYNYTRRTVTMRLEGEENVSFEASCYPETDGVGMTTQAGQPLTALSHHASVSNPLFPLYQRHSLCTEPLELLEQLATWSQSPTCLRAALGVRPDWVAEMVSMAQYDLKLEEADHSGLVAVLESTYPLLDEAQELSVSNPSAAARNVRQVRAMLEPYLGVRGVWEADATAQQALAQLENRYPVVLLAPGEVLYEVPSGGSWWRFPFIEEIGEPVQPPWDGSLRSRFAR